MALLAILLYEYLASLTPIPPGGDESAWLLLSYPYIGHPTPAAIQLFSYPPLSFPILGLSVVLGGGPLPGARLFMAVVLLLLGLATYLLARSLLRLPIVAVLAEAALLFQPDFQQLYYFGAYPNLFGLVFFFLATAFLIRYLRSRHPSQLAVFWGATSVAVLSHALVAVLLIGTVVIVLVLVAIDRRLPRELFTSRPGLIGFAVLVAVTLGYYLGSSVAGAHPPNYLTTNVLTVPRSQLAFASLLQPFYLGPIARLFGSSGLGLSATGALVVVWVSVAALLVAVVAYRRVYRRTPDVRNTLLVSWFLAVFGLGVVAWYFGLGADYRRLAFFLYPPIVLGAALIADVGLEVWSRPPPVRSTASAPSGHAPPVGRSSPWGRGPSSAPLRTFVVLLATLILAAGIVGDSLPTARGLESTFTAVGHDADFVSAMQAITESPTPGSILSATALVDHWPAALTGRSVYEPRAPTGFTYSPENLVDFEKAYLALHYRATVTNGQVAAGLSGLMPATFSAAPQFGAYLYGVLYPVLTVAPENISVTFSSGATELAYTAGSPNLPSFNGSQGPSGTSYTLTYAAPNVTVVETVAAVPGSSRATIDFAAEAAGPLGLTNVTVVLSSEPNTTLDPTSVGASSFSWSTSTSEGTVTTAGLVLPSGNVSEVRRPANGPDSLALTILAAPSAPAPLLLLSFELTSAGTSNTASGVEGYYSTPSILSDWETRFALAWNGTAATGPVAVSYLEAEYGATVYVVRGPWTVLLLPSPLPP